jgi:glycosyltransferase involved in cell wall biosynthesis
MKIAWIGTRGIPANYGGFETVAEEVATALVEKGHEVTVYCRPGNAAGDPTELKGVHLVYRPLIETKVLGTFTHTAMSLLHAVRQDFDVMMICNAGNGPLCVLPRLLGKRFAVNVDGLEWKRAKWGRVAKLYYQFGEWCSAHLGDRIISDSRGIQDYYDTRYKVPSTFVTNGAHVGESVDPSILDRYDLEPGDYFFVASRLEPENNADITVRAFEQLDTTKKLVIAGGANWDSPFVEQIERTEDPRVRFLGPVYEDGHIQELHAQCYAYVHGNEVGGTNPALLKALGYGNCVLALDVPFNAEVVGDAALLYRKDPDDLAAKMKLLIDDPELAAEYRRRAPLRIREAYTWPAVIRAHELLFERLRDGYYSDRRPSD